MIGISSTSTVLQELGRRQVQHLGSPLRPHTRFLSRWKLLHYWAIFFSRLYAFSAAKKDSARAHTLMVTCNECDPEVADYKTYAAYKKEVKYACAVSYLQKASLHVANARF